MRSLLVSPILPTPGWGGLALRGWQWVQHLRALGDVHVVIIPAAGEVGDDTALARLRESGRVTATLLPVPSAGELLRHGAAMIANPARRAVLAQASPLPARAQLLPMWLADTVDAVDAVDDTPLDVVVAFRDSAGLVGRVIAERAHARLVVDLDDDDAAFLRTGPDADHDEAAAHDRLIAALAAGGAELVLANPDDAVAVARRHGVATRVVANAAPLVRPPRSGNIPGDGPPAVLMVGNFDYGPNAEGAAWFVREVLAHVVTPVEVVMVGLGSDRVAGQLAAPRPHVVRGTGRVDNLDECYDTAVLAVAPLLSGSGTRLKVLEALAQRRALVATPIAVAGTGVVHGQHALLAETAAAFAAAVETLIAEPAQRTALEQSGAALAAAASLARVSVSVASWLGAAGTVRE